MSEVAQFGWLEWPVAVHWGDILFTLIYSSEIDNGATSALSSVVGLPETGAGGFNQRSAVNIKPPNAKKNSTFQSPSAGKSNTATGWVSAVHALQFNQPVKFCVHIPGPPATNTVSVPVFYAWRTFSVGDPLNPTFIENFDDAYAYQNDPTVKPWCYFPPGSFIAFGMGPACVQAGTRASAQTFLDWQNAHCGSQSYTGPGALPSGVEEVAGTGQQTHFAVASAQLTTTKKDGTRIDQQKWEGYGSSDHGAANAQVCFEIDSKGKITMTVSTPGWTRGLPPSG